MNTRILGLCLLFVLLCTAIGRAADDIPGGGVPGWMVGVVVAGNAADIATTYAAMRSSSSLVEANLLMRSTGIYPLKAGGTVAEVLMVKALWSRGHKRTALWLALGVGVGNGVLAGYNVRQMLRVSR